jgi:plastocyanin
MHLRPILGLADKATRQAARGGDVRLGRVGLFGAVLLGALLIGSVAEAQSATPATVKGVSVFGRSFGPAYQKVSTTQSIRFVNGDRVMHRIVSVAGAAPVAFGPITMMPRNPDKVPCIDPATGNVACPNATIGPFTQPGKYSFVCTIHRRMAGSFEVASTAAAPTPTPRPPPTATPSTRPPPRRAVSILGRSLSPKVVRVPQGGVISWKNGSTEDHWLRTVVADGSEPDPLLPQIDTGLLPGRVGFALDPSQFRSSADFAIAANARPGKFSYVCLLHPGMAGTFIVDRVDPTL